MNFVGTFAYHTHDTNVNLRFVYIDTYNSFKHRRVYVHATSLVYTSCMIIQSCRYLNIPFKYISIISYRFEKSSCKFLLREYCLPYHRVRVDLILRVLFALEGIQHLALVVQAILETCFYPIRFNNLS